MVDVFSSERTGLNRGFLIRRVPLWWKEASRVHSDVSKKMKVGGEKKHDSDLRRADWILSMWSDLLRCIVGGLMSSSTVSAVSDQFSFLLSSPSSRHPLCLCVHMLMHTPSYQQVSHTGSVAINLLSKQETSHLSATIMLPKKLPKFTEKAH